MEIIKQDKLNNCGPVAIKNYLTLNAIDFPLEYLEDLCILTEEGTYLDDISSVLSLLGVENCLVEKPLESIKSNVFYIMRLEIIQYEDYHFYLYKDGKAYNLGFDKKLIETIDPLNYYVDDYKYIVDGYIEIAQNNA